MKGQKGITLVALIITIIVMLILVAVTISVALNGGLFQKAKDARDKTVEQQVAEAATVAKAELLTDYYADDKTAVPAEDAVAALVKSYLGEEWTVTAKKGSKDGIYNVTATANEKTGKTTIDISSLFAEETPTPEPTNP